MKDWDEILKERFENEQAPLPENDREWFRESILKIRRDKQRRLSRAAGIVSLAIAASLGLIVVFHSFHPIYNAAEKTESPTVQMVASLNDDPIDYVNEEANGSASSI